MKGFSHSQGFIANEVNGFGGNIETHILVLLLHLFSDMHDQLEMFATEEDLENASLYEPSSYVGVVFTDSSAMSYRLRFPYNQLPQPSDYTESFGNL